MNNKRNKYIALLISLIMLFDFVPLSVFSEEAVVVDKSESQTVPVLLDPEDGASDEEEFWEEVISEHIDDYTVTVTVTKEAEFPIGTTVTITPLSSGAYRNEAANLFDQNDNKLGSFIRVFDITFWYDDMEIEPLVPVDVKVTFDNAVELEGNNELKLIHLHEDEEAKEITAETETTQTEDSEAIESLSFQSDKFSTYIVAEEIVVYTFSESGNNYEVVLKVNSAMGLPQDAVFTVDEITKDSDLYDQYAAQVAAVINPDGGVRMPALLDISLKTADGEKIQLDNKVQVIVRLTDEDVKRGLQVVHFPGEDPFQGESAVRDAVANSGDNDEIEVLDIESERLYPRLNTKENTVTFNTDSFSVFALAYTIVSYYKVASGETYKITLTYDENSGIPEGSELHVDELLPGTDRYNEYLNKSAEALNKDASLITDAHFFDIEITKNGDKIEPTKPVEVKIQLVNPLEMSEEDTLQVVHFADQGTEVIANVTVNNGNSEIKYYQSSFSVTAMVVLSDEPQYNKSYAVLVKYNNEYYAVLADGNLEKVKTKTEDGQLVALMDHPVMWNYISTQKETGANHDAYHPFCLYMDIEANGFTSDHLAASYYRRFLAPHFDTGLVQENGSTENYGNFIWDRAIVYDSENHWLTNTQYVGKQWIAGDRYLNIEEQNGELHIVGNQTSGIEVYLATVEKSGNPWDDGWENRIPESSSANHTVSHIDISIVGQTRYTMTIPAGFYYDKNGNQVTLNKNTVVQIDQEVPVDLQDIRNAEIDAYIIESNGRHKSIDNAYYITGYSQNDPAVSSTFQCRIEGSFKVANIRPYDPATLLNGSNYQDGQSRSWYYDNDGKIAEHENWGSTVRDISSHPSAADLEHNTAFRTIMNQRLSNKIYYTVSATKDVEFKWAVKLNGESQPATELYYDAAHTKPCITEATVTLSASLNYWDEENECPPIALWNYKQPWSNGIILGNGGQASSGMDFKLGAVVVNNKKPHALSIYKHIMNTEGEYISPRSSITQEFTVYQRTKFDDIINPIENKTFKWNSVSVSPSFTELHDIGVTVGSTGLGLTNDYNVEDYRLFYIKEKEETIPDTIVDADGNEWRYVNTKIETEYVKRDGHSNFEKTMHEAGLYTKTKEGETADYHNYDSVPEWLGEYPYNGGTEDNEYLEFHVYNYYEQVNSVTVKKVWKDASGANLADSQKGTAKVTLYRLSKQQSEGGSGATPAFNMTVYLTNRDDWGQTQNTLASPIFLPNCRVGDVVKVMFTADWVDSGKATTVWSQDAATRANGKTESLGDPVDEGSGRKSYTFTVKSPSMYLQMNCGNGRDFSITKVKAASNSNTVFNSNGEQVGDPVTLDNGNTWSYTWENLKGDYTYYITEEAIAGFVDPVFSLESGESIPAEGIESGTIVVTNQMQPDSATIRMRKRYETSPNNVYLGGAKFKLYSSVENYNSDIPMTKVQLGTSFANFDTDDITMISRSSNGEIFKGNLANGTYILKEVEAAEGYSLLTDPIEIVIDSSNTEHQAKYRIYNSGNDWHIPNMKNNLFELYVNNVPLGKLCVSKTVVGSEGDIYKDFNFKVTLNGHSGTETFATLNQDNETGTLTFNNGVSNLFALKHGESLTITGIPNGTTYTVEEIGANELPGQSNSDGYGTTRTVTSTINENPTLGTLIDGETETVAFTNSKPVEKDYSLVVTKLWKTNGDDLTSGPDIQFKLIRHTSTSNGSVVNDSGNNDSNSSGGSLKGIIQFAEGWGRDYLLTYQPALTDNMLSNSLAVGSTVTLTVTPNTAYSGDMPTAYLSHLPQLSNPSGTYGTPSSITPILNNGSFVYQFSINQDNLRTIENWGTKEFEAFRFDATLPHLESGWTISISVTGNSSQGSGSGSGSSSQSTPSISASSQTMQPVAGSQTYEVDPSDNYTFTLANGESIEFINLPWQNEGGTEIYTYSILETEDGGATSTTYIPSDSYNPAPATGEETGTNGAVTIVNKKVPVLTTGSLSIKKTVQASADSPVNGQLAKTNGTYTFTVASKDAPLTALHTVAIAMTGGNMTGATIDGVDVSGDSSKFNTSSGVIISELTPGIYIVKETGWTLSSPIMDGSGTVIADMMLKGVKVNNTNATVTQRSVEMTVTAGLSVSAAAEFTNELVGTRKQVTKAWNVDGSLSWPTDGSGNYEPAFITVKLQKRLAGTDDPYTDVLDSGDQPITKAIYPEENLASEQYTIATFDGLDPAYEYKAVETDIPEGYVCSVDDANDPIVITNTKQQWIDIVVTKAWDSAGTAIWPSYIASVTVGLFDGNGGTVKNPADSTKDYVITITSANEQKNTFTGLPRYDENGDEIAYSVKEISTTYTDASKDPVEVSEGGTITLVNESDASVVWRVTNGAVTSGSAIITNASGNMNEIHVIKNWTDAYGNPVNQLGGTVHIQLIRLQPNKVLADQDITPGEEYTFEIDDYDTYPDAVYYVKETDPQYGNDFDTYFETIYYHKELGETKRSRGTNYNTANECTVHGGGTLYIDNALRRSGAQTTFHKRWIEFGIVGGKFNNGEFYFGQLDGDDTSSSDMRKNYMQLDVKFFCKITDVLTGQEYEPAKVAAKEINKTARPYQDDAELIRLWFPTEAHPAERIHLENCITDGGGELQLYFIGVGADWRWGFLENSGSGQAGDGYSGNLPLYGYYKVGDEYRIVKYDYFFKEIHVFDGETHDGYDWDDPEDVTNKWWKVEWTEGDETWTDNRPLGLPVVKQWEGIPENGAAQGEVMTREQLYEYESVGVTLYGRTVMDGVTYTWIHDSLTLERDKGWSNTFKDLESHVENKEVNLVGGGTAVVTGDVQYGLTEDMNPWTYAGRFYVTKDKTTGEQTGNLVNYVTPKGKIRIRKIWENDENYGYTGVLLKVYYHEKNTTTRNDFTPDLVSNPEAYGLTSAQFLKLNGTDYLFLGKNKSNEWVLDIDGLHSKIVKNGSNTEDCYYCIEEVGYVDANGIAHAIPNDAMIRVNDGWNITPSNEPSPNQWVVTYSGTTGTEFKDISGTKFIVATPKESDVQTLQVENRAMVTPGSLTVTKTVSGVYETTEDDTFPFTVKVGNQYVVATQQSGSTTWAYAELSDTETVYYVKKDQTITFVNLPNGTYKVEEGDASRTGYTLTTTYKIGEDEATNTPAAAEVTVGNLVEVTINNDYELGKVQATKVFSGMGDLPDTFKITATWSIAETKYTKDLIITKAGTLADNEMLPEAGGNGTVENPYTWTIEDLPADTVVTFRETGYDGVDGYIWSGTVDGSEPGANGMMGTASASGAEELPETAKIDFVNTYTAGVELPATGGPGTALYTFLGLMIILLAGGLLAFNKKRNGRENR